MFFKSKAIFLLYLCIVVKLQHLYFWSFFRALCYYESTINVPIDKIIQIINGINIYTQMHNDRGWYRNTNSNREKNQIKNYIKYILCSILFSLRFRKLHYDFLSPGSELHSDMVQVTEDFIPRIPYPKTMFNQPQDDDLNDYVLRFLNDEATEADFDALQGLVTLV